MSLVTFTEVTKKFANKTVVEGVSFKIEPSTINVLIGPNGAGKSTIAKLLLGIEKTSSGEIEKKDNLKISYIPQNFKPNKELPITCRDFAYSFGVKKEDVALGLLQEISSTNISNNNIVDMSDMIWRQNISDLSTGQMQFFMISIAFSTKPDLVVLDEPTSFLDVDSQKVFYNFLDKIRRESNVSIFLISHELHTVTNIADQILCINHHICCSSKPFKSNDQITTNIGIYEHKHDHDHKHYPKNIS